MKTILPVIATLAVMTLTSCVNTQMEELKAKLARDRAAYEAAHAARQKQLAAEAKERAAAQEAEAIRKQAEEEAEDKSRAERRERAAKEIAAIREDFVTANPQLSDADKRAIRAGNPIVGLSVQQTHQLIAVSYKVMESGGVGGTWTVRKTGFRQPNLELYFLDGKLVRWIEL